jgi:hypothetical protein
MMKPTSRSKKSLRAKKPHGAKKSLRAKEPQRLKKPDTVHHKSVQLAGGESVEIRCWTEGNRIFVAAFNDDGKQVTAVTYSAEVPLEDEFYGAFKDPLVDSLAEVVEYGLLNNPELHYRP